MMALGDSMTAGFAMKETVIVDGIREFRGSVYSIGGDGSAADGDYTLPNFFEVVNGQKPQGWSTGTSLPLDALHWQKRIIRPHDPDHDRLNGAQSMALSYALPEQITYLASQAKNMTEIDFENDWKVLTIFMGANNVCEITDPTYNSTTPDGYISDIRAALTQIHSTIPRVYVNLVGLFNISQVYVWDQKETYCKYVQDLFQECPALETDDATREKMDLTGLQYNALLEQVAAEWEAQQLPDFRVVYQPAISNLAIETLDDLSGVDCFHPSYIADANFAEAIWNNMWSPPGQKSSTISPNTPFVCPTADSVLQ